MLTISVAMPMQTQPKGSPAGADASDYDEMWGAWDEFFTAVNRARGRAARTQADGLTIPQYRLLSMIADSPQERSGELAERVGVSAPTTTRMLAGLERTGIVRRDPLAADRRAITVTLTAKGTRLLERKEAIVSERRRALYESLSASERRQVRRVLRRLAGAIEAL